MINVRNMLSGTARRASHTTRYSSRATIRKENIAEHCWHTSFYAYVIATHLQKNGAKIDFGLLMSRSVLHDIEETETGDLQRSIKHGSEILEVAMDDIGTVAIRKIERENNLPTDSIYTHWKNAKCGDLEGFIVRLADCFSVVAYVVEEYHMGNHIILSIADEVTEYLGTVLERTRKYEDARSKPLNPSLTALVSEVRSYFTESITPGITRIRTLEEMLNAK